MITWRRKREVLLKTFEFRRNLFNYFKQLNECIQNTQEFEKIEEFIVDEAKYEIKIGRRHLLHFMKYCLN